MHMGKLPRSAIEARLAVTLFLLLLGVADFFGAWQVKNFASFTPSGVAATLEHHNQMDMNMNDHAAEVPVTIESLNQPTHHLDRELLVQDTHVHVPVYAMTAAFLAMIILGLELSSAVRVFLILLSFAAPFVDFAGLWGAEFFPAHAVFFGAVTIVGGFAMGIAYVIVLIISQKQFWLFRRSYE